MRIMSLSRDMLITTIFLMSLSSYCLDLPDNGVYEGPCKTKVTEEPLRIQVLRKNHEKKCAGQKKASRNATDEKSVTPSKQPTLVYAEEELDYFRRFKKLLDELMKEIFPKNS